MDKPTVERECGVVSCGSRRAARQITLGVAMLLAAVVMICIVYKLHAGRGSTATPARSSSRPKSGGSSIDDEYDWNAEAADDAQPTTISEDTLGYDPG